MTQEPERRFRGHCPTRPLLAARDRLNTADSSGRSAWCGPSETDRYFPITGARYEQALIPRVTFAPIPSLWGHTAGAASNPADLRFLNDRIAAFLNLK